MTQSARQNRGRVAFHAGRAAEQSVARAYIRRGCVLVAERWRGPGGEIDLILRDGDEMIFVEVKHARDFDRAAQSLSARQMHRLMQAAEGFLASEPRGSLTPARFDVALVNGQGELRILENAFGQG